MALYTLGLSHHTAPLALRERVSIGPERADAALKALAQVPGVRQAAILSTCNRTELYLALGAAGGQAAQQWLYDWHRMNGTELDAHLYHYQDAAAVRHVLRVATGLDSLVVGEPQVLGQLKDAYREARAAGTLGRELERLFQHSFAAAKRVRSRTALGENPVSVAYAAVRLAKQIFDDLSAQSVLLIGAGETMELVARHLRQQGVRQLVVANRHIERAQSLAQSCHGSAIALNDLKQHLADADIIITGTASQAPVLSARALHGAQQSRKRRPVFIVDLGVPRDVEPTVAELDDVFLYTVDDLKQVIEQGLQLRRKAAREAEDLIELEVDHFMSWLHAQRAVPAIRGYRELAGQQRDAVLEEARAMLDRGEPAPAALEYLAHALTRRLTHLPSVQLRAAAVKRDDVLAQVERLLGITHDEDET